jgi:hypothetical protein
MASARLRRLRQQNDFYRTAVASLGLTVRKISACAFFGHSRVRPPREESQTCGLAVMAQLGVLNRPHQGARFGSSELYRIPSGEIHDRMMKAMGA